MNRKNNSLKITTFLIILIFAFPIILSTPGCSKLNVEIFGVKIGENNEEEKDESYSEDTSSKIEELDIEDGRSKYDILTDESKQDNIGNDTSNHEDSYLSNNTIPLESNNSLDISKQREYFLEGLKYLEDESYLIAEYYFNKIKDKYFILQDHVLYYLAKSLLLQEKFDLAEEHYLELIQNHPYSIWSEKSNLDYADLFFIKGDYVKAEEIYSDFSKNFPDSEYIPYSLFQLAICQEKNGKYDSSYENYKRIWLNYPENQYSDMALENLNRLAEEKSMEIFIPTANQIYNRGKIFFSFYHYESAIEEFNKILQEDYLQNLSQELYSNTLFKLGMCYYNLRDYNKSKEFLSSCYEKFPTSSVADDCLYFLGRVFTNLDLTDDAITYYQKLLAQFPKSNYSDDALYRLGRIYYFREDWQNASQSYQRIINEYPSGDRLSEALWELGWIQYISGDYSFAKDTFQRLANSFKGTHLEEKALFWQAKSYQKLGETNRAIELYKDIINLNSYSYYTFTSKNILSTLKVDAEIPEIDTRLNPENTNNTNLIPDVYKDLETNQETNKDDTNTGSITHIAKAKELLNLELYTSASIEIEAGSIELEKDPIGILELSTLYLKSGNFGNSVSLIRKNYTKLKSNLTGPYKDYFYYLAFPYGYKELVAKYSSQHSLDPLFTLAVIREESSFKPDAGSFAGALGLMQIIPPTGKGIANQMGLENFNQDMLLDPETNIKMGTFYLRQMLDNFSQNKYFALGAYNGGPVNMKRWISTWPNMEIDEFIENIPYDETRNYIKKVMGSYYFYQFLYK